jgi:hypothetical protein
MSRGRSLFWKMMTGSCGPETGLAEHGYQVTTARRSRVQRICQIEPACIICDVTLPDFDGYCWPINCVLRRPPAFGDASSALEPGGRRGCRSRAFRSVRMP